MNDNKILSFKDLRAWQVAHELNILIFSIKISNNNLRNQIEKSSLSVTSNIAEGFGRNSRKDKQHFYVMARGSAYEVQSQLLLVRDMKLIREDDFSGFLNLSTKSTKLIHGLIKSAKDK